MSQTNAKLAARVGKFKLTAGIENDDGATEVDAQKGSEVKRCPNNKVRRGSEILEEVAEFEVDGDDKTEDIEVTLKQEISAQKEAILKKETHLNAYLKAKHAYLQSLEQQLAAIVTEKARKVVDMEGQSGENIFNPDPVNMALEIPLILENILGKLDFNSMMSSRAVAKYWNESALNLFSKPSPKGDLPIRRLNLKKLFESSDFNPFPELEPKLTKSIRFKWYCSNCGYEEPGCDCDSSKQKLIMFFEKFSTQIQIIKLEGPAARAPTFLKAIRNRCPNLKSLYLKIYHPSFAAYSQETDAELFEMESMPQEQLFRMNLTTIEFKDEYNPNGYEPLQRIIDRAPNLAVLKYEENIYPNLANSKNLKHLCFEGQVRKPNFSHFKLSEMLAQVEDYLKVLELETRGIGNFYSKGLSFPVMKMLKKLIIRDVFLYPLEQKEGTFIQTIASKFPNLEHLELGASEGKGVEIMLRRGMDGPTKHLKIQTLIVDRIQNPSVLALFNLWFPNLKELSLTMPKEGEIEHIFSVLGGLKLKSFSFTLEFCFRLSDLVKALDANQELFKGLDILEIRAVHIGVPHMVDDLFIIKNRRAEGDGQSFL